MSTNTPKLPISVIILTPAQANLSLSQRAQLTRAVESASFADQVELVEHDAPISDFARARNNAMKQARHEWIFFLDSDEWFAENAFEAVTELLSERHVAGIGIRRVDVFHNKVLRYGEVGQHYLIRFMRKDKSVYIRPVHEYPRVMGCVKNANLTIWHEGHQTITDFLRSITYYSEMEAKWRIKTSPNAPSVLVLLQLCTYPIGKFIANYIFKAGCFDGWHGLTYALLMSLHSLFVRVFWLEKIYLKSKK